MDVSQTLDEDFLFYLSFVPTFLQQVTDKDADIARTWLVKLLEEPALEIKRKRCRNIYMTQLLLCLQHNKLSERFRMPPHEVDISDAYDVFQSPIDEGEYPAWLENTDLPGTEGDEGDSGNINHNKGVTYVATRTLPNGQGAFAYVAISAAGEDIHGESKWFGGGEGGLKDELERKYKEHGPTNYEMEKILSRRKDPEVRQRHLNFYDVMLQNISDEIDGVIPMEKNEFVNEMIEQFIGDLKERNAYGSYEKMEPKQRRCELLLQLHERVLARKDKVNRREEILDEIEERLMPASFFETSIKPEDRHQFPAAMWEQAILKTPNKKNMEKLLGAYPKSLVEHFLKLLAAEKESIATRMQTRNEFVVSQMKRALREETARGKQLLREDEKTLKQIEKVAEYVKAHYDKREAVIKRNKEKLNMPESEQAKLYQKMRATLLDTQRGVEEEEQRGRLLAAQINAVTDYTEKAMQVNENSIHKAEEVNMGIMKNIKRLNNALMQYQQRLKDIRKNSEKAAQKRSKKGYSAVI